MREIYTHSDDRLNIFQNIEQLGVEEGKRREVKNNFQYSENELWICIAYNPLCSHFNSHKWIYSQLEHQFSEWRLHFYLYGTREEKKHIIIWKLKCKEHLITQQQCSWSPAGIKSWVVWINAVAISKSSGVTSPYVHNESCVCLQTCSAVVYNNN